MMNRTSPRRAILALACVGLAVGSAGGAEKLSIRVSPTMSMAPAYVVIRAVVEADLDNRALDVVAESNDFYTSSQVPLNGALAPRISEVRFAGLPAGSYQVTAVLVGSQGRRAAAVRTIIVGGDTPGGR